VNFEESLKVTMEHKGNRDVPEEAWYIERPDYFNSVAFWYQTGLPKPFGELPPWPDRNVPWENHHLVRAYRHAETLGAPLEVQTSGFFGGRPNLFWPNASAEGRLTLPFTVAEAGRYAVRLIAFTSHDYGAFDVELDGAAVRRGVEFRADEGEELDLLLGIHELWAGEHTLSFTASTAKGREPGYLGLEVLKLLKLPPEADREVKNENEAHFIRLGIGRAVYAYRLAYDELPESLEALIEAGMMEERYLRDENGHPILARREGEVFHTESTAPDGWKMDWRGLDARR
jgi:hypothetical protein